MYNRPSLASYVATHQRPAQPLEARAEDAVVTWQGVVGHGPSANGDASTNATTRGPASPPASPPS